MITPYYEDDFVTLYHADCMDVLPQLQTDSFGGVVTSPPYNMGDMSGGYANMANGYATYDDRLPHEEYVAWQRQVLGDCWRVLRPDGAIFYNHKPRIRDGILWLPLELNPDLPLRQIIIWARSSGFNWSETHLVPFHEWIMFFAAPAFRISKAMSSVGDVWRIHQLQGSERPDHPAPFPIGLAARCIEIIRESSQGPILDPFAGSGTTLRAAKDACRKSVGIEIDERYCEKAAKRMSQEVLDFGEPTTTEGGPSMDLLDVDHDNHHRSAATENVNSGRDLHSYEL